jgi:hypothetical protein
MAATGSVPGQRDAVFADVRAELRDRASGAGVAAEALELGAHLRGMLEAKIAVFLEGAIDDVFELRGEVRIDSNGRERRAIENGVEDQAGGVAAERQCASGHFVQDDTEREQVAARVDIFAADLPGDM